MSAWVTGDRSHIRLLHEFQCGNPSPGDREPWIDDVERMIRGFQPQKMPRRTPPQYLELLVDADGEAPLIAAVAALEGRWDSDGNHTVLFGALACHSARRGQGLGREVLFHGMDVTADLANEQPLTRSVVMLAEVHQLNEPCQGLLRKEGWVRHEPHATDPNYYFWRTDL